MDLTLIPPVQVLSSSSDPFHSMLSNDPPPSLPTPSPAGSASSGNAFLSHRVEQPCPSLPSPPLLTSEPLQELDHWLANAPQDASWQMDPHQYILHYRLPDGQIVGCVRWLNQFFITGTDVVRIIQARFFCQGRPVRHGKKFEEGIFSDLRMLKDGVDAELQEPRSRFLSFLFEHDRVRTRKKQKVFYWLAVPHLQLFREAVEREHRRELNNGLSPSGNNKPASAAAAVTAMNNNKVPQLLVSPSIQSNIQSNSAAAALSSSKRLLPTPISPRLAPRPQSPLSFPGQQQQLSPHVRLTLMPTMNLLPLSSSSSSLKSSSSSSVTPHSLQVPSQSVHSPSSASGQAERRMRARRSSLSNPLLVTGTGHPSHSIGMSSISPRPLAHRSTPARRRPSVVADQVMTQPTTTSTEAPFMLLEQPTSDVLGLLQLEQDFLQLESSLLLKKDDPDILMRVPSPLHPTTDSKVIQQEQQEHQQEEERSSSTPVDDRMASSLKKLKVEEDCWSRNWLSTSSHDSFMSDEILKQEDWSLFEGMPAKMEDGCLKEEGWWVNEWQL